MVVKRNSKARDTRYLEKYLKCHKCGLSIGTLRVQRVLSGPDKGKNRYYHEDCGKATIQHEKREFEQRQLIKHKQALRSGIKGG